MFHFIVSLFVVIIFNDVCLGDGWDPSNFTFNPGQDYELVWQDEFEDVGPPQANISGKPAYAPNPKNWAHITNCCLELGLDRENNTDSIYNSYVQDNQLIIAALTDGPKKWTSGRLKTQNLQEFTFGIFAAKIRLPYGQGIWPAFWLLGNGDKYDLSWPTTGEIDILEMMGGNRSGNDTRTDQYAHGTVHWNNESNTMHPVRNFAKGTSWKTPDGSKLHNHSLVYWGEWTPTNITIGINEFQYFHLNTTHIPNSINPVMAFNGTWPYYLILSLAVDVPWDGPPDNTTVFSQHMVVDWVRVYQKKAILL